MRSGSAVCVPSGLLVDLYELTMAQAYLAEGMHEQSATFSLFVRRLPKRRNYLLACGLQRVLSMVEDLRFTDEDLRYLASLERFSDEFLWYLADFRWRGSLFAVPEGTPVFAEEPLLEAVGPLAQVQLLETMAMNQMHLATVLASKASRIVQAAQGRKVVDFGVRRMHGIDAGVEGARAFYVAGVAATSDMLAGRVHGIPVAGTMAHSYIQAHEDELSAFRAFAEQFPTTILLVDTYDTMAGIENVIRLAEEISHDFQVRGVRLDSGDLGPLADQARSRLDEAGLNHLEIFASGGLDETEIEALVSAGHPIDGFGVGTGMGVSDDAPALDMAYKLVASGGVGRMKLSQGKRTLPGQKQIHRQQREGQAIRDVLARFGEPAHRGRALIEPVMRDGQRLEPPEPLDQVRTRVRSELERLPPAVRGLAPLQAPFPVELSTELEAFHRHVRQRVAAGDR